MISLEGDIQDDSFPRSSATAAEEAADERRDEQDHALLKVAIHKHNEILKTAFFPLSNMKDVHIKNREDIYNTSNIFEWLSMWEYIKEHPFDDLRRRSDFIPDRYRLPIELEFYTAMTDVMRDAIILPVENVREIKKLRGNETKRFLALREEIIANIVEKMYEIQYEWARQSAEVHGREWEKHENEDKRWLTSDQLKQDIRWHRPIDQQFMAEDKECRHPSHSTTILGSRKSEICGLGRRKGRVLTGDMKWGYTEEIPVCCDKKSSTNLFLGTRKFLRSLGKPPAQYVRTPAAHRALQGPAYRELLARHPAHPDHELLGMDETASYERALREQRVKRVASGQDAKETSVRLAEPPMHAVRRTSSDAIGGRNIRNTRKRNTRKRKTRKRKTRKRKTLK
jgi:hypothetical protein